MHFWCQFSVPLYENFFPFYIRSKIIRFLLPSTVPVRVNDISYIALKINLSHQIAQMPDFRRRCTYTC
jgi:hypothetical protein